ncbi:hypothetical protein VmeM32_00184 [Vibrio phage vB_VmeM-32]|nr:hypothetical protein VmeM32_00184 [Vibrio phage vB_VmeM-32]
MTHNKLDKFRQRIEESAFSKRGYSVTLDGARILSGLMFYGEGHAGINEQNTIERMTPAFQRDNDKWSEEQKIRFVENVIAGYKSTIILGTCNENDGRLCYRRWSSTNDSN